MKLIRNKYKDIIKQEKLFINNDKQLRLQYLHKKLEEELKELSDSKFLDACEYADVFQVLEDLANIYKISLISIENCKEKKRQTYGNFSEGVYLKEYAETD